MIKLNYPQFWQKKGFVAILLLPISSIFFFLALVRGLLIKPRRLNKKLICVGNATVGGTGKTQLVAEIAQYLQKQGVKFVIYTKAYGATLEKAKYVEKEDSAELVGDESILLAQYGPVIAAKKFKHAQIMLEADNSEVIIADDGMQSPYFEKDLVISVIDAHRGYGNGYLFPAGPMRMLQEEADKKTDLIFLIGKQINHEYLPPSYKLSKKLVKAHTVIKKIINLKGEEFTGQIPGMVAFAGIGNPEKFFVTLFENNINCLEEMTFPDHHNYTIDDIAAISKKCEEHNAYAITTEKDIVRIKGMQRLPNIFYTKVRLDIESRDKLERRLLKLIKPPKEVK